MAYIDLLLEELEDAQQRLCYSEEPEGKAEVKRQIKEISCDIQRLKELSSADSAHAQNIISCCQ